MPFKPQWTFAFLILIAHPCFADDDHEMEEFLKREYSLSKPYQGKDTQASISSDSGDRCFQKKNNHVNGEHFTGIYERTFFWIFVD